MFAGKWMRYMAIQYQYFSINKNENGLRQTSSKYTSIYQVTPLFIQGT